MFCPPEPLGWEHNPAVVASTLPLQLWTEAPSIQFFGVNCPWATGQRSLAGQNWGRDSSWPHDGRGSLDDLWVTICILLFSWRIKHIGSQSVLWPYAVPFGLTWQCFCWYHLILIPAFSWDGSHAQYIYQMIFLSTFWEHVPPPPPFFCKIHRLRILQTFNFWHLSG